jgi:hypothetical protein
LTRLTIHPHRPMTMTDADRLLQTYIERFEQGGSVDPTDLLKQAEGRDRARLSALIEGYLEHAAPAQEWDSEAFEGSVAQRATELVQESWAAESAALPQELVALRKRAELKRSTLVQRLAEALGFPQQEAKVAVYYNAMEHGTLPPKGISAKVFDALAALLDTSADALRKAGEAVTPSAGGEPGEAFARAIRVQATDEQLAAASPGRTETESEAGDTEPDEVDRLFTEG